MEDRQSRLPEYVGKKIVEALKQDKEDIQILEADNSNQQLFEEPATKLEVETPADIPEARPLSFTPKQEMPDTKFDVSDLELPDNVMMLVKLINQLPTGVNRQIGAQIIRQTIEAMGISMKSVLSEAQYIQEDLGNSTQDCLNSIEEYKNNIKVLEQKITLYKKQASKLGELINLFVMTIK
ncbi:MAG: hypothetical protein K6A44_00475 [bacterium]|nr:hypothetical protein [bacterium]